MKYIKKTFSENMGGGSWVDFLILYDGRCIGLNDECLAIYDSYEHFCGDGPHDDVRVLDLLKEKQNDA